MYIFIHAGLIHRAHRVYTLGTSHISPYCSSERKLMEHTMIWISDRKKNFVCLCIKLGVYMDTICDLRFLWLYHTRGSHYITKVMRPLMGFLMCKTCCMWMGLCSHLIYRDFIRSLCIAISTLFGGKNSTAFTLCFL